MYNHKELETETLKFWEKNKIYKKAKAKTKGKKSLWVTTISKKESFEILKDIKGLLDKNDFKNYNEIFYGSGKYPLWAGYSIGYNLIEIYLENNPNLNWNKLLRENPQKIIKETTSPQTLAKNL